ncbi:hypothetical protein AtEden1_Chr3g0218211 [Arabidopsis thaliana]
MALMREFFTVAFAYSDLVEAPPWDCKILSLASLEKQGTAALGLLSFQLMFENSFVDEQNRVPRFVVVSALERFVLVNLPLRNRYGRSNMVKASIDVTIWNPELKRHILIVRVTNSFDIAINA